MVENYCDIVLWGTPVGRALHKDNRTYFQYDKAFVDSGALEPSPIHFPLSPKLYDTTTLTHFNALPGFIADSLPDSYGNRIIEKYFKERFNKNPYEITPVQKLLYIGRRGVGALEFHPPQSGLHKEIEQALEIADLAQAAQRIVDGEIEDALPEIIRVTTDSMGGAKAKATVGINSDFSKIVSGAGVLDEGFDHWMIKFSADRQSSAALIGEHLLLNLASRCGITTATSSLIESNGLTHLAVKRFDREHNDKPYHLHSLAGMSNMDFRDRDTMSYELLLRTALHVSRDYSEMRESYKRMCFNAMSGNQDDHAKNHSFIMDKQGNWKLSPAYDITPSFGYGHQMHINGKIRGVKIADLEAMAKRFDINEAHQILEEISDVLHDSDATAKSFGLSSDEISTIKNGFKVANQNRYRK